MEYIKYLKLLEYIKYLKLLEYIKYRSCSYNLVHVIRPKLTRSHL